MWIKLISTIENRSNNSYYVILFWCFLQRETSNCIKFDFQKFSKFLLSSVATSVNYLFPLQSSIYPFALLKIKCKDVWCYITNAVNKNTFSLLFVYFDVIRTKIFDIDCVIDKAVRTIFYIDSFFPTHL